MKRVLRTFQAGAGAAALALLLGCGSTSSVNSVEPAAKTGERAMLADQRVVTDKDLAKTVRVVGVNTATDAGGFLKVQVEVRNTTRKRQLFTYRVQWFDPRGMVIDLPTAAAMPRSIEGGETAYLTTTAPTIQAKDFRIQLLEPVN